MQKRGHYLVPTLIFLVVIGGALFYVLNFAGSSAEKEQAIENYNLCCGDFSDPNYPVLECQKLQLNNERDCSELAVWVE